MKSFILPFFFGVTIFIFILTVYSQGHSSDLKRARCLKECNVMLDDCRKTCRSAYGFWSSSPGAGSLQGCFDSCYSEHRRCTSMCRLY
jgi:hypothetical protein